MYDALKELKSETPSHLLSNLGASKGIKHILSLLKLSLDTDETPNFKRPLLTSSALIPSHLFYLQPLHQVPLMEETNLEVL